MAASLGCGNPLAVANLRAGETVLDLGSGGGMDVLLSVRRVGSVDVVISNCVVNLSSDKPVVFAEIFRVLKPGGRMGISDAVAEGSLALAERVERGQSVGCVAGALSISEYRGELVAAGFAGIEITPTMVMTEGIYAALIQAGKPCHGGPSDRRSLIHVADSAVNEKHWQASA